MSTTSLQHHQRPNRPNIPTHHQQQNRKLMNAPPPVVPTPNKQHKKLKASKFNPNVIPNTPPIPMKPNTPRVKKERESLKAPAFLQNRVKKEPPYPFDNASDRSQIRSPDSSMYSGGVRASKKRKTDHDGSDRKRVKHTNGEKKKAKSSKQKHQKFDRSPFEKKLMQELRFRPLAKWSCDDVYHFLLRQFEDNPIVAEELKNMDGTQLPYHIGTMNPKIAEHGERLQYLVSSLTTLDHYKPFPSGYDIRRRWMKLCEERQQFIQGLKDNFPIEKSATDTMNHFIVNVLEKKMKQRVEKLVYTYSLQFTGGLPPTRVMMDNVKHVFRANWDVKIFCDFERLAEKAIKTYFLPETLTQYLTNLFGIIYAMELHIPKLKFFPVWDWHDGKDGSGENQSGFWLGIKAEDGEAILCKPTRVEES